jgi:glycosyltransferase involved in cell wall biosynthesis
VPAYNEAATIEEILRRVAGVPFSHEIIVVDDGSTDGTAELAAAVEGVRLIRRPRNAGKGAAVRDGIAATSGAIVVIQDADLEYDPTDLPRLLQPLVEGHADVGYGTRLRGGSTGAPTSLALRRQPLAVADHQRPLQHDDQQHRGGL